MLHFSDQALQTIRDAMQSRQTAPAGLRVGVVGSPCSGIKYVIRLEDTPDSEDEVVSCQGLSLIVDRDSVIRLQGVKVDFISDGERRGFTFDNPNVSSSCSGCNKAGATQSG